MDDNWVYITGWTCCAVFAISIVAAIGINHYYDDNRMRSMEKIVIENGISPAVVECLDRNWDQNIGTFIICKEVLTNHNLSRDEAERLVNQLRDE